MAAKVTLLVAAGLILLSGIGGDGYSVTRVRSGGVTSVVLLLGSVLGGAILVPALLPWLPGRPFALKGAWIGIAAALAVAWYEVGHPELFANQAVFFAWMIFLPAVTSYLGMNFTGASTYTSPSGVMKEMKIAVPIQIGLTILATGLWITGLFV